MLDRRLERVSAVAAFVESMTSIDDIDRRFPMFAERMMHGGAGIRSIELQRSGIIDWVYPAMRAPEVLHGDARRIFGPAVAEQIAATLKTDRTTVAGPIPNWLGGLGIVARRAIRSRVAGAPDLVSVVVHLDSLLLAASTDARIENLTLVVLDRAGRVVSPLDGTPPADAIRAEVEVPDGKWEVMGAPRDGWAAAVATSLVPLRVAIAMIVLLMSAVAFGVLSGRSRLEAAVHDRTRELNTANRELQSEIEERAKAEERLRAQEEQLLQSQKVATIGAMAGSVAHDFNNFLTAIIGFGSEAHERASELEVSPSSEGARQIRADLDEVLRAAEYASALTQQLLAFSRRGVVQTTPCDVGRITTEAAPLLRRLLGPLVQLETRVTEQPVFVYADREQLVQVLLNLAVNARDAMPDGGRLSIAIEECVTNERPAGDTEAAPGPYVRIVVSDTGSGMTPEVLSRVFEPFFTTKSVGKGTGLGLATVVGIVRRAHGFIEVASELGQGTEFRVHLPLFSTPIASATS